MRLLRQIFDLTTVPHSLSRHAPTRPSGLTTTRDRAARDQQAAQQRCYHPFMVVPPSRYPSRPATLLFRHPTATGSKSPPRTPAWEILLPQKRRRRTLCHATPLRRPRRRRRPHCPRSRYVHRLHGCCRGRAVATTAASHAVFLPAPGSGASTSLRQTRRCCHTRKSTRAAIAATATMYATHTAAATRHTCTGRYMVGARRKNDLSMTTSVPARVGTPHSLTAPPAAKAAWVAVRVLRARQAAPAASCDASAKTPETDTAPRTTMVENPNNAARVHLSVVRAIPATSAPSHIRYTLRHEAETCLIIKEMGPLGFSVNAIDPILVFNGHDGILEGRINSEAQKWGGRWTCPIREAKWGWSGAGPNVFCVLIGRVKLKVYRHISV